MGIFIFTLSLVLLMGYMGIQRSLICMAGQFVPSDSLEVCASCHSMSLISYRDLVVVGVRKKLKRWQQKLKWLMAQMMRVKAE